MDDELLFRWLKGRANADENRAVEMWRQTATQHESRILHLAQILEATAAAEASATRPSPPPRVTTAATNHPRSGLLRRTARWPRRHLQIAAAALLVLGTPLLFNLLRSGLAAGWTVEEFVTGPNEKATAVLSDGSVVRLAPDSRLQVLKARSSREVRLRGQAFFAVAKDARRPFRIHTGAGLATVLGTRFDLSAAGRELRLVVIEGRVALSSEGHRTELRAGEMTRMVNGITAEVLKVPDPSALVAWTGRFLVFQETPLSLAAKEIERQYAVEVRLSDSGLAARTITTWLVDWPLKDAVDAVCRIANATCSIADGIVSMSR